MKLKLTKAGRTVIFLLIAVILCVGGYFGYQYYMDNFAGTEEESKVEVEDSKTETSKEESVEKTDIDTSDATINLSLDEWIG